MRFYYSSHLNVPRHLNIKGILQVSLLGVALGTDCNENSCDVVRTLGDTGDLCFSEISISTANEVNSTTDDVDTE